MNLHKCYTTTKDKTKWGRRLRNSINYQESLRKWKSSRNQRRNEINCPFGKSRVSREPEGNRKSDPAGRRNSRNLLVAERIGGIAKGTERRSSSDFAKEGTAAPSGTFFQVAKPRFTKADVSSADREIPLVALRWRCRPISTSDDLPN